MPYYILLSFFLQSFLVCGGSFLPHPFQEDYVMCLYLFNTVCVLFQDLFNILLDFFNLHKMRFILCDAHYYRFYQKHRVPLSTTAVPYTLVSSSLKFPSTVRLQSYMHAKLLQSCLTPCDPVNSSPPGHRKPKNLLPNSVSCRLFAYVLFLRLLQLDIFSLDL